METIYRAAILITAVLAFPATADNNFGVGVKAGTLGLGLEGIWKPVVGPLDFRLGVNAFNYSDTRSYAGINYDGSLKLQSFYATANFKFPMSPFRLTAGAYVNNNKIKMLSLDSPSFEVGGTSYTATEVGTLTGKTKWGNISPYVGTGLDFSLFGKVALYLDVGVLLQGDPKVTLTSTGSLAGDPLFIDALEAERQEIEDKVDVLKFYPAVSLGFKFNF